MIDLRLKLNGRGGRPVTNLPAVLLRDARYKRKRTSKLHNTNDISRNQLTLRLLMSYIYMEHPFLMFLDHTQRRSTVGRTPLDE